MLRSFYIVRSKSRSGCLNLFISCSGAGFIVYRCGLCFIYYSWLTAFAIGRFADTPITSSDRLILPMRVDGCRSERSARIWRLLSCEAGKAGDRSLITHPILAAGQARWHALNTKSRPRAALGETRVAAARSPGSAVCCRRILARWFSRGNKYTMLNLFHYIYYDIYFDSACTEVVTLKKGKSMGAIMLPCVKSFYCYPNFKTRVNIIIYNSCL